MSDQELHEVPAGALPVKVRLSYSGKTINDFSGWVDPETRLIFSLLRGAGVPLGTLDDYVDLDVFFMALNEGCDLIAHMEIGARWLLGGLAQQHRDISLGYYEVQNE